MTRPRLLDLFCCQGGASEGYRRAGFDVTGVDVKPQPRYPFPFVQADAVEYLRAHGHEYDAVHASPPCQDHSALSSLAGTHGTGHLLDDTLAALRELGQPWIVENVEGAPMPGALVLCGSEFGLSTVTRDGRRRWLRRHRLFLANVDLWGAGGCGCTGRPAVGIYGNAGGSAGRGYKASTAEARELLGCPWMDQRGLSQALPPVYTQHLGEQLLAHVRAVAA